MIGSARPRFHCTHRNGLPAKKFRTVDPRSLEHPRSPKVRSHYQIVPIIEISFSRVPFTKGFLFSFAEMSFRVPIINLVLNNTQQNVPITKMFSHAFHLSNVFCSSVVEMSLHVPIIKRSNYENQNMYKT